MQENPNQFNFQDVRATKKIFELTKRIRAIAGGTSASKTISILVWCIDYCQSRNGMNKLVSVVSESFPHLQKGAITDFQSIMKDRKYWKDDLWNESKHTYTFETGNKLEFFSVDTYGKAHGPRRDVLFVNEANNLEYRIVDQLITRTREVVWLDWNPSEDFWFYTEMIGKREDIDFLTLTYLDNEALDENSLKEILSHRNNKSWWTVYGEGKLGQKEENIYKGWRIIDEIPHEAKLIRRGLDFGYTNDPTALLAIYRYNGAYIWDEELYQKGLSNKEIADVIQNLEENTLIIADSAEPKSIDELRSYGLNILPSQKGKDSVKQGIQKVQDLRISITKRSINGIKEFRNYRWNTDKNDKILNEPRKAFNHLMDAGRYATESLIEKESPIYIQSPYQANEYEGMGNQMGSVIISTPEGGKIITNPYQQQPIDYGELL